MRRGWIGVDLDGTLSEHYWPEKGPYDPLIIGAPIRPMVERVKQWLAQGQEVRVFTARVGHLGSAPHHAATEDVRAIEMEIARWTLRHCGRALEATARKDYNMIELWDDRAVRVLINTGEPCCTREALTVESD